VNKINALCLLLVLSVCAACGTLAEKTALISIGDSIDEVIRVMGSPPDRQLHGKNEAWQYCISGAGFGWNDHRVIWFYDGIVTGISTYTTSVTGCRGGIRHVRWEDAPEPKNVSTAEVSQGTCFLASGSGDVVTSNHVIEAASEIYVTFMDGMTYEAEIKNVSASTDIAILGISEQRSGGLSLAVATVGQEVFTIGFPTISILGKEPKFTDGTISSLSGIKREAAYLQTSVPIQPGNSGGPLVSDSGEVLGMIAATAAVDAFYSQTGSLPQNVNWAVKSEYIQLMMTNPGNSVVVGSRAEAIEHVRSAICRVEARM